MSHDPFATIASEGLIKVAGGVAAPTQRAPKAPIRAPRIDDSDVVKYDLFGAYMGLP